MVANLQKRLHDCRKENAELRFQLSKMAKKQIALKSDLKLQVQERQVMEHERKADIEVIDMLKKRLEEMKAKLKKSKLDLAELTNKNLQAKQLFKRTLEIKL